MRAPVLRPQRRISLRPIYHRLNYDIDRNVLEAAGEPPTSQLKLGIRHTAYPRVEVNGLVYTYMSPPEKEPPGVHWLTLPKEQVDVGRKLFLECNWLQSLDGDNDRVHTAYLHPRGLANDQRYLRAGGGFTPNTGANSADHGSQARRF